MTAVVAGTQHLLAMCYMHKCSNKKSRVCTTMLIMARILWLTNAFEVKVDCMAEVFEWRRFTCRMSFFCLFLFHFGCWLKHCFCFQRSQHMLHIHLVPSLLRLSFLVSSVFSKSLWNLAAPHMQNMQCKRWGLLHQTDCFRGHITQWQLCCTE